MVVIEYCGLLLTHSAAGHPLHCEFQGRQRAPLLCKDKGVIETTKPPPITRMASICVADEKQLSTNVSR